MATKRAARSSKSGVGAKPGSPRKPAAESSDPLDSLWSLEGRLTEVARAQKVKITAKVYAALSMDGLLFAEGCNVRRVGGTRFYSDGGADFASLRIEGDAVRVEFRAPDDQEDLSTVRAFYAPVPDKPGWLSYERPATRDPRPALDAKLGSILGRAKYERRSRR